MLSQPNTSSLSSILYVECCADGLHPVLSHFRTHNRLRPSWCLRLWEHSCPEYSVLGQCVKKVHYVFPAEQPLLKATTLNIQHRVSTSLVLFSFYHLPLLTVDFVADRKHVRKRVMTGNQGPNWLCGIRLRHWFLVLRGQFLIISVTPDRFSSATLESELTNSPVQLHTTP